MNVNQSNQERNESAPADSEREMTLAPAATNEEILKQIKKIQDQMRFLEKKVDTLLEKSQGRPSRGHDFPRHDNRPRHDRNDRHHRGERHSRPHFGDRDRGNSAPPQSPRREEGDRSFPRRGRNRDIIGEWKGNENPGFFNR